MRQAQPRSAAAPNALLKFEACGTPPPGPHGMLLARINSRNHYGGEIRLALFASHTRERCLTRERWKHSPLSAVNANAKRRS